MSEQLIDFPKIKRSQLTTLQVNLGYRCNQRCSHCHVDAGPNRKEMMHSEIIKLIPIVLNKYKFSVLDLTGGAPEMHPEFQTLVELAKKTGVEIIDRCNLTILNEPGYEYLSSFLANNKVTIIASLPCYEERNVDKQRGYGVFERSIEALKSLNKLGYGKNDSELKLNLVFNPLGPMLPPSQKLLENKYREELKTRFNIYFSNLYTITNMPIKRFADQLHNKGQLESYYELLRYSYNKSNLDNVMCRDTISIDWNGYIYDCDFNQQLGLKTQGSINTIKEMINTKKSFVGEDIVVSNHCFGCTAGSGSSCGGALS